MSAANVVRLRLVKQQTPDLSAGADPCPFACKREFPPILLHDEVGPTVICQSCGAVGPVGATEEEALALWNGRADRGGAE